jgi:glycosyltransferase involved in cell wall biosynthesis
VWPSISKTSDFSLELVGANIDQEIRHLASGFANVEVVGFVDSMSEKISQAFATFCFVDLDVGIQTKVLESMACGTPVICTDESARGVGARDGVHCMIAESPAAVAGCLKRLREDPTLWSTLSISSRDLVKRNHDWEDSGGDLVRGLGSLRKSRLN